MSGDQYEVSRRRFLAWIGAGTAAAAGGWAGFSSLHDEQVASSSSGLFSGPFRGPEREVRTLHYALGTAEQFHTDLHLIVGGTRVNLVRHDSVSRRRLAISNPVAARTDLSQFTHLAPQVNLPTTRPLEIVLWGTQVETGDEVIVGGHLVFPAWSTRRIALATESTGALPGLYAEHRMARNLGLTAETAPKTAREVVALGDLVEISTAIAQKIVFKHPSIISMDPESGGITGEIILGTPLVDGLVTAVETLLTNTGVYGQMAGMVNAEGGQQTLDLPGQPPGSGKPVQVFQPFAADGTTYLGVPLPTDWTSAFRQTVIQTVSTVANLVQDTVALEGTSWHQATGTAPTTVPGTAVDPDSDPDPDPNPSTTTSTTTPTPPPTPQYSIDDNWHSGTRTTIQATSFVEVTFPDGSTGHVPQITVRVFNNNEKVYQPYGQYFDADKKQVAPASGVQQSATDLSEPLAVLYSCPTILGIPLFAQNYVDYIITFPTDAIEARILLGTMGGRSGWQQNLVDSTGNQLYPGVVFPPQCKQPVIWTTVLNLALPTMMLALDIVALAGMLKSVFKLAQAAEAVSLDSQVADFFKLLKGSVIFQAIARLFEGTMPATEFGGPDKPSIVAVLVELGLAIIGLLSIPALAPMLTFVLGASVQEPEKAIPIVGEVLMAISIAADVAVLTQTVVEVATDPWVTTRSLTGQYDTTVTIKHDQGSTVFPAGARKWTLTPHLAQNDSLTALEDSSFQSTGPAPTTLTVPVTKVPLGGQIRYSLSMTDANGWIVGMGSTKWLDNFDPTNLPVPEITIRELAPPVTSSSTFTRTWTTQYDTAASAYSWSTAQSIPGTIADQQSCDSPDDVCRAGAIAIGTATGYIGYTYQTLQGWYVRQLGFGQDPSTHAGGITTPFPGQPLVHYDLLSQDAVGGQNFLLEPIAGVNAYHVRQLDLTAPNLGLTPGTSWGVFLDTIHGIVLHPAGFLMGFNTDSGKLHILELPDAGVDEDLAPEATQHGGTGNATGQRPGLTQRPVDIAVALNGIVLVLEQEANRIQAFDVRGNPTPYFLPNGATTPSYYLPLVTQDTYLGLSVDGQGYIYTLSYAADGFDVSQYGVDCYDPSGNHVFRSTGVNGATFVVDYWRNVYTQNFQAIQNTTGGTYLTAQGVAEPSTTVWVPNTPNVGGAG